MTLHTNMTIPYCLIKYKVEIHVLVFFKLLYLVSLLKALAHDMPIRNNGKISRIKNILVVRAKLFSTF